jgi:hypothetical protein
VSGWDTKDSFWPKNGQYIYSKGDPKQEFKIVNKTFEQICLNQKELVLYMYCMVEMNQWIILDEKKEMCYINLFEFEETLDEWYIGFATRFNC